MVLYWCCAGIGEEWRSGSGKRLV